MYYIGLVLSCHAFYTAIEGFSVNYFLCRLTPSSFKSKTEEEKKKKKLGPIIAYFLLALSLLRDMAIMSILRSAPSDMIYGPSAQKIMSYQSIFFLLVSIWNKYSGFKSHPIEQMYYPIYEEQEQKWDRGMRNPFNISSMALYVTTFFWQPSTTALVAVLAFPVFQYANRYYEKNCTRIHAGVLKVDSKTV